MKQPNEIILKLDVATVDKIATILQEQPYRVVRPILDTIVSQANDPGLQSWAPPKPLARPKSK